MNDWTNADAIEVQAVGYDTSMQGTREYDVITDPEILANYEDRYEGIAYSLYWHYPNAGVECFADCEDQATAELIAETLSKRLGLTVNNFIPE